MNNIKGKIALVTGGTKGIGHAIAEALASRGACVFICARSGQDVDRVVSAFKDKYGQVVAGTSCDIKSFEQVRSMMRQVVDTFGGLDILINNAGVGSRGYVEEMKVEEWNNTIETNLSGVFYCCHEAIPLMKRRGGGFIINIASLAGKNAFPGGASYNASKFGLVGFSEALMQEVRYDHIRVSYVMPGSVNTEFGMGGGQSSADIWKLLPADVADVVVDIIELDNRALASRVELRPSEPKK